MSAQRHVRSADRPEAADVDRFFARHLEAVAARLEARAGQALERQRAAWREAIHRQALLDERQDDADGSPGRVSRQK